MEDIENFEVLYMSESSVSSVKDLFLPLTFLNPSLDLGDFDYACMWNLNLDQLQVNIGENYFKGIRGTCTISGAFHVFLDVTTEMILEINSKVTNMDDIVFSEELIIDP
jgi:hypothetical protein